MSAVICGSMAYDTIMVFDGQFKNHILPDKMHMLNISFLVPEMHREFGGCAGNIAYNLKLLGSNPIPVATVGTDFATYRQWLSKHHINTSHIKTLNDYFTAQAFMTTDTDNNQITAFHPGAMAMSHTNQVSDINTASLAIISPDSRDAMLKFAMEFSKLGTAFIFDPGQAMPLFDGAQLRQLIQLADYVTVNDYESHLLEQRTGWHHQAIAKRLKAYIVTRGANGSDIHHHDQCLHIPAVKPDKIVDPTGCGDAYRAGFIYGLEHTLDLATTGRIASLMGAIKIASQGTQNHAFSMDDLSRKYQRQFGHHLP